jgi:hypothetical protein
LSPSFLTHLARLPFSMVGESAGISTWIGMDIRDPRYSDFREAGGDEESRSALLTRCTACPSSPIAPIATAYTKTSV